MRTNPLVESLAPRVDDTTLSITIPHGVPVTLFANREGPIQVEALEQALGFVSVQRTITELDEAQRAGKIRPFWGDRPGQLERVVLTPDFHRGSGIPVGSKGVGIYFITQSPGDLPETVLAQLGNKIQHALRAFTPGQQKDIKAVVDGFRPNPALQIDQAVQELKVGEANVSLLDAGGTPAITERTLTRPPVSRVGVADISVVQTFIQNSPVAQIYTKAVDRESAYETLKNKAEKVQEKAREPQREPQREPRRASPEKERAPRASNRQSVGEALVKSVVRAAGSQVGRQITNSIIRGILGGLTRG